MARHKLLIRAFVGVVLLTGIAIGAARITAEEAPKKIRIVYTDDMQGNWIPCG